MMTKDDTQHRPKVPDVAVGAYRVRREALAVAIADLGSELDEIEAQPTPDLDSFGSALRDLLATLRRHVEESDAPDGLIAQVIDDAPLFARQAEQLRGEHDGLLEVANDLIERAEAGDAIESLVADARELARRLSEHRQRGTDLLLNAYMLDMSASD